MEPQITTLDTVRAPVSANHILSTDGINCTVLTLSSGEETPLREAQQVEEHLIFVIEGEVTVHFDDMNTIVNKEEALVVAKSKAHVIAAGPEGAKFLQVDVPLRHPSKPEIVTFNC